MKKPEMTLDEYRYGRKVFSAMLNGIEVGVIGLACLKVIKPRNAFVSVLFLEMCNLATLVMENQKRLDNMMHPVEFIDVSKYEKLFGDVSS